MSLEVDQAMSLEVNHGENIDRHRVRLLQDMDTIPVLRYFTQESNLDSYEIEQVKAGTTRSDKCSVFLDLITRSGVDTYYVLVKALVQVKPHLACLLLQSENEELRDKLAVANREVNKLRNQLRSERLGQSVQANNMNEAGTAENATEKHDKGEGCGEVDSSKQAGHQQPVKGQEKKKRKDKTRKRN